MKKIVFTLAILALVLQAFGQEPRFANRQNKDWSEAVDANIDSLQWLTPNADTGTTYTFVWADHVRFVTFNNSDTVTVTVPANSAAAWSLGTTLEFGQVGAGPVVITGGGAATINAYDSDTIMAGQYAVGSLLKTGTNTWLLMGNF